MEPSDKIETRSSKIWIDEEGILHLKIMEGARIDLEEMHLLFNAYRKLGCDKHKRVQLIEGSSYFTLDRKAIKAANAERGKYILAAATVNNSLSMLLLFRFIQKFYKLTSPIKMFQTKSEALQWLRTLNKGRREG